eukprot:6456322-Amphidinium_carterae.2
MAQWLDACFGARGRPFTNVPFPPFCLRLRRGGFFPAWRVRGGSPACTWAVFALVAGRGRASKKKKGGNENNFSIVPFSGGGELGAVLAGKDLRRELTGPIEAGRPGLAHERICVIATTLCVYVYAALLSLHSYVLCHTAVLLAVGSDERAQFELLQAVCL